MVDPELEMIFIFVMVIATLALTMAQLFHRRTVKHEERKLELKAQIAAANAGQSTQDADAYRKLEERVRVLERIATDGNNDLALQIEQTALPVAAVQGWQTNLIPFRPRSAAGTSSSPCSARTPKASSTQSGRARSKGAGFTAFLRTSVAVLLATPPRFWPWRRRRDA